MTLRDDANQIIKYSIKNVMPNEAVNKALFGKTFNGKIIVISVGKAGYEMAKSANDILQDKITKGICITKYGHIKGLIPHFECYEAGHPVVDQNSILSTEKAIEIVQGLTENDTVLFLLSGGASALFEKPTIPLKELIDIFNELLASGKDIVEINKVRKKYSMVKGGKFLNYCAPASVYSIILSDVLGNQLDYIGSGPTIDPNYPYPHKEFVTGSVKELCKYAKIISEKLGYKTTIITDCINCEAKDAGKLLGELAQKHHNDGIDQAFIVGGETVVQLTGKGKGGRNQEIALSASKYISGMSNVLVFSIGSDGTDGPTDAAGGIVDGSTMNKLSKSVDFILKENDSYNYLKEIDGLIFTGPTGTNVNDISVLLIKG